jgi:hypothetical protein
MVTIVAALAGTVIAMVTVIAGKQRSGLGL